MSDEINWIKTRIAEAQKHHPLVTDAASTRLGDLLNGQISERPLRPLELADIAKDLLADMTPPASQLGQAKQ